MIRIYVLNVPEFAPLLACARDMPQCRIRTLDQDYSVIESDSEIIFNRKALKMKPAVWYGIFTSGLEGEIAAFGREEVRVIGSNAAL